MSRQQQIIEFLKNLRDNIITSLETFEPKCRFQRKLWNYQKGKGGGEISVVRGDVFEKAAVNWSGIWGDTLPLENKAEFFFATGVSLIIHPLNPYAPTSHMNIRFFETEKEYWFGGGYDLTPMGFPYDEDTLSFHDTACKTLDAFDSALYPSFSQKAKEYFFIPHYQRERGVGGIFFDHYHSGNFDNDYLLWKSVGESFIKAVYPIYQKRVIQVFSEKEREIQLEKRGAYVEFNLLYDLGTKFGFLSGGNPEAILCSMPPLVKW